MGAEKDNLIVLVIESRGEGISQINLNDKDSECDKGILVPTDAGQSQEKGSMEVFGSSNVSAAKRRCGYGAGDHLEGENHLAVYDRLLTVARRARILGGVPTCSRCGGGVEDFDHVLRSCPESCRIWMTLKVLKEAWIQGRVTDRTLNAWLHDNNKELRICFPHILRKGEWLGPK
ncbi:hypothetical protein K1719_001176 [Acacia pycnantha]|nr:hypothetical protein K1719_001176 [Acacia pycnantha]